MTKQITAEEEKRYAELQKMALDFARQGNAEELRKMIEAGMPVNLADHKGQSLLMLASYNGNEETTRMLLDAGADTDQKNDRGQTPLGGVAFKGYNSIAKLLIDYGADVHANNGGGMTPLHYAAMFGRHEVAQTLEENGASLTPKKSDKNKGGLMPVIAKWIGQVRSFFKSK